MLYIYGLILKCANILKGQMTVSLRDNWQAGKTVLECNKYMLELAIQQLNLRCNPGPVQILFDNCPNHYKSFCYQQAFERPYHMNHTVC